MQAYQDIDMLSLSSIMPTVIGVLDTTTSGDLTFNNLGTGEQSNIAGYVLNTSNFTGVQELCRAFVDVHAQATYEQLGITFNIPDALSPDLYPLLPAEERAFASSP
jgi:hypothetical protein